MRKDTRRKFCWHSPYDLSATERWLEAQAQKGLLLRRWDTPVVFDRVGEPRQVHYRLEPICPALPRTQEQDDLYRQSGWQEVCTIGREFRVWSSTLPPRRSSTRTRWPWAGPSGPRRSTPGGGCSFS